MPVPAYLSWPTPVPICDGRCSPGAVLPGSPPEHADAGPSGEGRRWSEKERLPQHAEVGAPQFVVDTLLLEYFCSVQVLSCGRGVSVGCPLPG